MFVNPGLFAIGVGSVVVPILIHLLLRQRRKPVQWGAMRFLLEAYRRQRRVLTIQQLILLACRCLILMLLALAIGRLVAHGSGAGSSVGGRTVYLLIDNSIAADAVGTGGGEPAFDRHKGAAAEALRNLGPQDRAALISLASPAAGIALPASGDAGAVARLLNDIVLSDAAADVQGALSLVASDLAADGDPSTAGGPAEIVIISDLPAGVARTDEPLQPVLESIAVARPLSLRTMTDSRDTDPPDDTQNVSVVSVDPLERLLLVDENTGDQQATITLRRTGTGVGDVFTASVTLSAVGALEETASLSAERRIVSWDPGEREVVLTLPVARSDSDGRRLLVASADRDALGADNIGYATVIERRTLRVGIIGPRRFGGGPSVADFSSVDWLEAALAPRDQGSTELTPLSPAAVDDVGLARLDAVLLPVPHLISGDGWGSLARFVDRGGLLLVSPPAGEALHLWTERFVSELRLPWLLEREAARPADTSVNGDSAAASQLLRLVAGELVELTRSLQADLTLVFAEPPRSAEVLLRLGDGSPWIVAERPRERSSMRAESSGIPEASGVSEPRRGLVVLWTSAIDPAWTTAPLLPVMVPLINETVRQGVGDARGGITVTAGTTITAPDSAAEHRGPRGVIRPAAPGATIPLRTAGEHTVHDAGGREILRVLVNPSTEGADLDPVDAERVAGWLEGAAPSSDLVIGAGTNSGDSVMDNGRRTPFDLMFLTLAAAFIAIETTFARWFSHARRGRRGGDAV